MRESNAIDLLLNQNFDRASLVVSYLPGPNGVQLVISRYTDEIWDFSPYITQENLKPAHKKIDWRIRLKNASKLTDVENRPLLESCKDFIWSLFSNPVEGIKRPKMATLIGKFKYLIPLVQWMVANNLTQFSQLRGRSLDYLEFAARSTDGNRLVSKSTLHYRLLTLEYLYLQRGKLEDAVESHPWPEETALSLAGVRRGGVHRKPTTEVIPDDIASQLSTIALTYVREYSSQIFSALQSSDDAGKKYSSYHKGAQTKLRSMAVSKDGFRDVSHLKKEALYLRTACYIVIGMFSGIRDSEMMSLAESCISRTPGIQGGPDLCWLHGTIYKTGVRKKKWLVPTAVADAVEVLTLLSAPLRRALKVESKVLEAEIEHLASRPSQQKALLTTKLKRQQTVRNEKDKLFLAASTKHPISVLSGTQANRDLKTFCKTMNVCGPDGLPYQLHAHQFRRTYARFIARAELGDLLTLRDHFGHWSLDMTTYYADGGADEYRVDSELLDMVADEKLDRQKEIVAHYLDSNSPVATTGHWMHDWRTSVRTAKNKEELIKQYAGTITLNGTGHSWCVGNSRNMGCGGLCVFEAQLCVDCNYGIIGQEHRPVWEGIRAQQIEALALDDMGPGGRERAATILGKAEKVLAKLDGKEDA